MATTIELAPSVCRMPAAASAPPNLPEHPLDQKWQTGRKRLWVQVDCRSVAELVAGRAWLEPQDHAPLFRKIVRKLLRLHSLQVKPLTDQSDLVLWSPREFNTIADHAANAAMDERRDWEVFDEGHIATALQGNCNLRLCVDGGRRSAAEGALGFALYSADLGDCGTYTYTLLARRGQLLQPSWPSIWLWIGLWTIWLICYAQSHRVNFVLLDSSLRG